MKSPLAFFLFNVITGFALSVSLGMPNQASAKIAKRDQPLSTDNMRRLAADSTFIVFDWDDNIMKLPSKNVLFVKGEFGSVKDPRVFLISSTEFSQFKSDFGKPGTPLERYEIIHDNVDPINGTFRFSRPGKNGRNYMHEDMTEAVTADGRVLAKVPKQFKAPFYDLYILREANPRTRRANRILTGRGQSAEEFFEAMSLLAEVPEVRRTGYKPTDLSRLTLVGGLGPASELKAADLILRMNEAAAEGYRLFAFPDDDPLNIRRAAEALAAVPRPIDVWLIWTREKGDSVVVDLSLLKSPRNQNGISLEQLFNDAFQSPAIPQFRSKVVAQLSHLEDGRNALICRSIFF